MWLVLVFALSSCNYYHSKVGSAPDPGTRNPVDEDAKAKPTYADIHRKVLEPYCLRCHQGADPKGGIDLSSYRQLVENALVVPGDEDSMIYIVMKAGDMPKSGPKPSADLVELVRVWIMDNDASEK